MHKSNRNATFNCQHTAIQAAKRNAKRHARNVVLTDEVYCTVLYCTCDGLYIQRFHAFLFTVTFQL